MSFVGQVIQWQQSQISSQQVAWNNVDATRAVLRGAKQAPRLVMKPDSEWGVGQ